MKNYVTIILACLLRSSLTFLPTAQPSLALLQDMILSIWPQDFSKADWKSSFTFFRASFNLKKMKNDEQRLLPGTTVNQILFVTTSTLFFDFTVMNYFAATKPYSHLFYLFITNVWQKLIRGEKYSRQWVLHETRENFSYTNKSLFTVLWKCACVVKETSGELHSWFNY